MGFRFLFIQKSLCSVMTALQHLALLELRTISEFISILNINYLVD